VAVSGSGDHHGSSPPVGVMWHPETKKPAGRRVLRKGWCYQHQTFAVTAPKRDAATETPFQSSGIRPHSSSKIPPRTCYQWPQPLALWRVSRDWVQEFVTLGALWSGRTGRLCTRPNRAAAHPSTDTHTGRHEKTGQKAPESHQEPSNREGVVSGGGALSERAEGRQEAGNGIQVR